MTMRRVTLNTRQWILVEGKWYHSHRRMEKNDVSYKDPLQEDERDIGSKVSGTRTEMAFPSLELEI